MSCEIEAPPFIRYDDIWPTCEGATPIIEVAIRQRLINIDLVLLHHQLAQSLHLIASLEIKGVHSLSLFDQRVVKCQIKFLPKILYSIISSYREGLHFSRNSTAILHFLRKSPTLLSL